MNRILIRSAIGALAGVIVSVGHTQAQDLKIALGAPATFADYEPLMSFARRLKEDAGINATVYPMSLLSLAETPGGLRDGLADIGYVVTPYQPVEYSEVNLPADLSMFITQNSTLDLPGAAMVGATLEYVMLNCADCQNQLKGYNQVYLAASSTPPLRLLCSESRIASLSDMAGKRIRTGAANYARWVENAGGTSISMSSNELFDALGRGAVDCTISNVGALVAFGLADVVKYVTMTAPGGVFSGVAAANVNRDVWLSLDEKQREAMLRAAARLSAETIYGWTTDDEKGLAAAKEKNIELVEADETLDQSTAAFLEKDIATMSAQYTDKFGLQNVEGKIEIVRGLMEKWQGLTSDIGEDDVERLAELYWNEIYSKVDSSTYAMQ